MRILHVISTLNIGSGIANAVINYYKKIDREKIGFDFLVFSEPPESFTEKVKEMGARVFEIARPSLKTSNAYQKKLDAFFTEHKGEWEWVHIHEILVQKYVSKSVKKAGGIKIAIHSHSSRFVVPDHNLSKLKNAVQACIKRLRNAYLLSGVRKNADAMLACSKEAGKALFGKRGIKDARFTLLPNGIDAQRYALKEDVRGRYRDQLGLNNKKVILHIGRLCGEKNQLFLLETFNQLSKTDESYVLLLVGDGALKETINRRIKELGLSEKVQCLGNRSDAPDLYMAGDVFVFPSIIEGLGISLIEAQASGLNCIASTGVPTLAKITPYVRFLPLSAGTERWAEEIKSTPLTRTDGNALVKESAFNIENNIRLLTKVYEEK